MNTRKTWTWIREGELDGREDARGASREVDLFGAPLHGLEFWIDNTEGVESGRVLGWDEGAINAGVAEIVGCPEDHRSAYYRAYAKGALAEAWVIRREMESTARKRYVCSPEHPMPTGSKGRWEHTNVVQTLDFGDTRWVKCQDCGVEWHEELPQ